MFFILSKVLVFLIKPITWIAFALLGAVFIKNEKWRRRSLYTTVGLFFFFSNHFICNQVFKWWEPNGVQVESITQPYDIGILLGGYSNSSLSESHGLHNLSERGNRFVNALELYHRGKIKKIMLSGGSGNLYNQAYSEAEEVKAFLLQLGIPPDDIIIEPNSRNTWETALFSKKILDAEYPGASCLLITSAWNMQRAKGCFDKVGIKPDTYPVDFISENDRLDPEFWLFPEKLCFYRWELLIKEWVGCLAYAIKGYL